MRSICELTRTSIRGDGTPPSLEGSMAMEKSIVNRPFRMETPKKNRRQYAKTRKNIRKSMNILQPQKKTTQLLNSEIMVHDSNLLSLFIPNKISPVYHGPHWSHRSRPTAPGHLFIHQAVTGLAEVPAAAAVHGGSRLHHPGGRMRPLKRCRHGWYISWMMWLAKVMLYIYMYMYVHIYVYIYIYIITGVYIYYS